jgi:hypothetical protein
LKSKKTSCPGANGLSDADKSKLRAIAAKALPASLRCRIPPESANAGGMREFKTVEGLVVVTNDAKMSGGAEKIDDGRHGNSLGDRDEARVEARGTAFRFHAFRPYTVPGAVRRFQRRWIRYARPYPMAAAINNAATGCSAANWRA